MATLARPSPPRSPSRMPRRWARKCERYCCIGVTYFPLVFVYGITTWAVWVEASIGFQPTKSVWIGKGSSFLGLALYALLNWSYTTAVFTNPGSTTDTNDGYNSLPTHAPPVATSFTVKSTGEHRFCKKCQAIKPDRAHHCSTCRRCVLKMDHHCPWLATCVGLRNYKAFLLFLSYTTLFCFICFAVSGSWVWEEILSDGQYTESLMPVNYVMLAVISGIIGIVLFGFTGWHILLAARGQTTIECLEKTRYLSPLRKSMKHHHIAQHQGNSENGIGQQLMDIHSNSLPGVIRPEEGDAIISVDTPIGQPIHQSYDALERFRARERYEEYLDEQDSSKLPNAFDLGWKKNILHIFGNRPLMWFVPICTTIGDGWSWEPSPKWIKARDQIREERVAQAERERAAGWGGDQGYEPEPPRQNPGAGRHYLSSPAPAMGRRSPSKADRILGRDPSQYSDSPEERQNAIAMQAMRKRQTDFDEDDYDTSSDELEAQERETDRRTGATWPGQRVVGASGLLGKGQVPREGKWGNTDAVHEDDID